MQSNDSFVEPITPSEPVEIDPTLWAEVSGGSPRNSWSSVQRLFGSTSELGTSEG